MFFCDSHVRIQKKTCLALTSPLIKFERMSYVFSQNCLNKSQIPCKRKFACKTNTAELLCVIWDLRTNTNFFFFSFNVFSAWVIWFRDQLNNNNNKIYENLTQKQDRSRFIFIATHGLGVNLTLRFCLWAFSRVEETERRELS